MTANNFGLYLIITKPSFSYRKIAETAVKYNVQYLQLREKSLSDREILKAADEIMQVTNGTGTKFILNDRADLAFICGADGLHLGQDDISLCDAKKICGEKVFRFGLSTHNLEQVKEAVQLKPDYIGFGPIFTTPTKAKPDPVVGTEMIPEAVKLAGDIPVVAIGGIDGENLISVLDAGARNVCMVRYFMNSMHFETRVKETVKILNDYGICG
ncbi:thiamine-phosphate pyrophosphorylase [Methanocorpusculum labreanum Z]|uniref:Thiamine-phosphate synthase n=1 Tax=Methanocorpusculum labreanum (strain ATCC 43576 / DSM 4855 / Z) TaxID=410358 RepID=A2SQ46_METLZ|nr:thiamine phosphate synthase [Methanocorpusculum labreanum]ABN06452.1 thiamine-phosphate pyrophosphorylase [Methanocorpusculum labreanum Z]